MSHDPTQKSDVLKERTVATGSACEVQTQTESETEGGSIARPDSAVSKTTGSAPATPERPSDPMGEPAAGRQLNDPEQPTEKLRVLLVDDDGSVRRLVGMALQAAGFEVLEAADGNVAVQLCEQTETIHLVLADVLMPKLSGRQLASHVVMHHPEARVLLMSGYPNVTGFLDGVVGRAEKTKTEFGFIQKPFGPAQLIQKIREMLQR